MPNGKYKYDWVDVRIDEATLQGLPTPADYFRATNEDKLEEIYQEIDTLERTQFNVLRYQQNGGRRRLGALALVALAMGCEIHNPEIGQRMNPQEHPSLRPVLGLVLFLEIVLWLGLAASWIAAQAAVPSLTLHRQEQWPLLVATVLAALLALSHFHWRHKTIRQFSMLHA